VQLNVPPPPKIENDLIAWLVFICFIKEVLAFLFFALGFHEVAWYLV
jgi:hypothetical protein